MDFDFILSSQSEKSIKVFAKIGFYLYDSRHWKRGRAV